MSAILSSRLLSIMQQEFDSLNFKLPANCQQQIEQLVSNGVARMRATKAVDHPGHVMAAERNLKALVRYFCDFAREEGTYPTIDGAAFRRALLASPIYWPYSSSG